jgi:hypothetical protein
MASLPTFFFSHARQDQEVPGRYMVKFYTDLELHLAQLAGHNLNAGALGTIDRRIPHGADWDEKLSGDLAQARAFVAVETPLYYSRPNCGKELGAFLLRSPGLGVDAEGKLTQVQNILRIRWLPENAYGQPTAPQARVPVILHRIEDVPADDLRDPERRRAIERYKRKGMERCVDSRLYKELIWLLVSRLFEMADLAPAPATGFSAAPDAFRFDWQAYLNGPPPLPAAPAALPQQTGSPAVLASAVVFHITTRPFASEPVPEGFADRLVTPPVEGANSTTDPRLLALLTDLGSAGEKTGMTIYNAACDPPVPTEPWRLLAQLQALSRRGVPALLFVDPAIWPGTAASPSTAMPWILQQIVTSSDWSGTVVLANLELPRGGAAMPTDPPGLSNVFTLPAQPEARIDLLQRALVDARGRALGSVTDRAATAAQVPLLNGLQPRLG